MVNELMRIVDARCATDAQILGRCAMAADRNAPCRWPVVSSTFGRARSPLRTVLRMTVRSTGDRPSAESVADPEVQGGRPLVGDQ